jgi:flavin-dependent dehydrogenase
VVCEIQDRTAAMETLRELGAEPQQSICWVGVEGGFSTVGFHVGEHLAQVGILTGSSVEGEAPDGPGLMEQFRAEHPWVGKTLYGGSGRIPIRRPYARLVSPGLALIGDVGCQVFPAHASGIGASLLAARYLAEAVVGKDDPGALEALWGYQVRFHRSVGAINSSFEALRHVSQELDSQTIASLFDAGLITRSSMRSVLEQRPLHMVSRDNLHLMRGVLRQPWLVVRLAPWVARIFTVYQLSRLYPGRPSAGALRAWSHLVARLLDTKPDIE